MISLITGLFFFVGFLDLIGCISAWILPPRYRFKTIFLTIYLLAFVYTAIICHILYTTPSLLLDFSYDGVVRMLQHPLMPISATAHFATGDILISAIAATTMPTPFSSKIMIIGFKCIVGAVMFIWNPIALLLTLPVTIAALTQIYMMNQRQATAGNMINQFMEKLGIPQGTVPTSAINESDPMNQMAGLAQLMKTMMSNPSMQQGLDNLNAARRSPRAAKTE